MRISPRAILALALGLGAALTARKPVSFPAQRSSGPGDPTFRDFIGVNHLLPPDLTQQLGLGWVREDMAWPNVEPQKGHWSWGGEDQLITRAKQQGLQCLPMLGYTPAWAAGTSTPQTAAPAKNLSDWQNFVEQAVSRYSASPFSLRYFQVWNEPTRKAGFWGGTNEEFIDKVYLPAAKIIRQHHCYVVFGGWPQSNSLQELDQVLNYHGAWQWTDIVDEHYHGPSDWEALYNTWIRTKKCRGIWATEVGYTADVSMVPRLYLEALHVALQTGWSDPDEYKLFWFQGAGGGGEAALSLAMPGPGGKLVLSSHGVRLKAANEVLGGGPLSLFSGFKTDPPLGTSHTTMDSAALGYKVGSNRIVIAILLIRDQNTRSVIVRVPLSHRASSVKVVNSLGSETPLNATYANGNVQAQVPRAALHQDGAVWSGYLVMDGI